ncbi:MAG: N-acetylmuramoyl-L-alanine amidase [Pseudomonadota bacterium]
MIDPRPAHAASVPRAALSAALSMALFAALPTPGAWASDTAAATRLERAVLSEKEDHLRLGLTVAPSVPAEMKVLAEEGRLVLAFPGLSADSAVLEGAGLGLTPGEDGLHLEITGRHLGLEPDLRALSPLRGESMAFAIGAPEVLAALPALVPLPRPRPVAVAVPMTAAVDEPQPFTVVIDAGHGGHDPGAVVRGIEEKDLTLVFARRLALRLSTLPDMRAVLTREGDRFLPLGARLRFAVAEGADLFLSLHADTVTEGDASGLSVYTLTPDRREDVAAEITAEAPRDAILRGVDLGGAGDDVTRILVDLAQRRTGAEEQRVAAAILTGMGETVPLLTTRPHRNANFRVLHSVDFPAILVELGFLSNEEDRKRLTDRRWQAMAADRMTEAIDSWRRDLATRNGQE